jgi:hypothetical protein
VSFAMDPASQRIAPRFTHGAGRLDVDDDAELHVDEIVVGVSEECASRGMARTSPRIAASSLAPAKCHSACNIDPLSRGIGVQN